MVGWSFVVRFVRFGVFFEGVCMYMSGFLKKGEFCGVCIRYMEVFKE